MTVADPDRSAGTPAPRYTDLGEENILEARGITKRFGGVQALRGTDLVVLPGEVHALLGANGAGKSTLVKILAGVLTPDSGSLSLGGVQVRLSTVAQARADGIGVVFQDPALPPSLTLAETLKVFGLDDDAARVAFHRYRGLLGATAVTLRDRIGDQPPTTIRLLDLARVMAMAPRILILDELTAELPADQSERVFQQLDAYHGGGGTIIYVSHRLAEVRAVCTRATVLRDGQSAGVVELADTTDAEIMALMIGVQRQRLESKLPPAPGPCDRPALETRELADRRRLRGVSIALRPGEILGVAALQDQGAHELLECVAGVRAPVSGRILVHGAEVEHWSVARAVSAGLAYIPAERGRALLPQRSVAANVGLALEGSLRRWLRPLDRDERARIRAASDRMAIDTRAAAEVRQLSGGNQQKVVVARWLSRDLRILVAFDPTRGIDVLTKREIYGVFRELAASGVAILFYSSDLAELLEVTHRIVALYEGRMHATIPTPAATEAGLLTALHGLPVGDGNAVRDASLNKPAVPRRDAVPSLAPIAQGVTVPPSALPGLALPGASPAPATVEPAGTAGRDRWSPRAALRIRPSWRHAQVVGVYVVLALTLLFTFLANHQALASFGIQTLAETAVPLAFAALAQMCAILVRGIDLSIGSQIALINVLAAVTMHRDPLHGYLFAVGLLVVGAAIGGLTGLLITLTRIPDIIATLATSSVLAGIALFILPTPGGSIPNGFANGLSGTVLGIPTVLILLFVVAVAVWWPFRRSVVGLRVFATGGDHAAARLAGLSIGVSRVLAYAAGGLLCALAGLVLSAQTLGGDASVGAPYTLNSIAVAVIGGAALTGGVGTAIGVIGAAFFLTELISMLFFYGVDPNLQTLLQGAILIVVMGSLGLSRLRRR